MPFVDAGGGGSDAVVLSDAAPVDTDAGSGQLEIADVPDTPCGTSAGTTATVFSTVANVTPLSLVDVGARRGAFVSNGDVPDGLAFMDGNGGNASSSIVSATFPVAAIASTGTSLFAIGVDSATLRGAWFDSQGSSTAPALTIATQASGPAAGGANGTSLAVWLEGADLRAAGFTAQNTPAGPAFDFRRGLSEKENASLAVAHQKDDRYGVAHSSSAADKDYRLTFTVVSTVARIGTSYTLAAGPLPIRVVSVAHTAKGFAILVELDLPAVPAVIFVDDAGKIVGSARRLLGARRAYGIASSGGELGVLVHRLLKTAEEEMPEALEFRSFDALGEPLGAWACLDAPATAFDFDMGAAISAEAEGYAVLMRDNAKQVVLRRFDRRGLLPPK